MQFLSDDVLRNKWHFNPMITNEDLCERLTFHVVVKTEINLKGKHESAGFFLINEMHDLLIPVLHSPLKDTAPLPQKTTNQKSPSVDRGTLLMQLSKAPHFTSSPQSTRPKVQGTSTYRSPRTRPTTRSQTATRRCLREPSCFPQNCMFPHPVIRETRNPFFRKTKMCSTASLLGTQSSFRCPCPGKPRMTWAAHLSAVPSASKENSQTERPSG